MRYSIHMNTEFNTHVDAHATLTISPSTNNGRACLKGVFDIESDAGWLGFGTVFGATRDQVQSAAYHEADVRASARGAKLQRMQTL